MVELLLDGRAATETFSNQKINRIVVVGIGNDGRNRVQRMLSHNVQDVSFVVVDADPWSLDTTEHDVELIQLGQLRQFRNEGPSGWDSDAQFLEIERAELRAATADADLVFITAGIHRDIDPETVSQVSSIAKETQALVVGVVTAVFNFEQSELSHAVAGADRLLPYVDGLIVIHNDRLPDVVDRDSEILPSLTNADEIVAEGIMDLSEFLTCPGKIDVSLADFRSIISQPGPAVMSKGVGRGNNGTLEAAHQAIASPFVQNALKGAHGILLLTEGGRNLTLGGVYSAGNLIGDTIGKQAALQFGMSIDHALGDEVRVTLIATNLNQGMAGSHRRNSLATFDKVESNKGIQDFGTPQMGLLPQADVVNTNTEQKPAANTNLEIDGHSADREKSVLATIARSFGAISRLLSGSPTMERSSCEGTNAAEARVE